MNLSRRRSTGRGSRGAAAVETALLLPLVAAILLGTMEFSLIGHHKLGLVQGARAGVRAAALGKPASVIRNTVKNAVPPGIKVRDEQILVEFNTSEDGRGDWIAAADSGDGTANAVPFGHLVRVRVHDWPHELVTGAFFDWLPGVSGRVLPLRAQMAARRE